MVTSALVRLADEHTWEPGRLTAASFRWPDRDVPTLALGDVTTGLVTDGWADTDVPVITPSGLDPIAGGIRRRSLKYRGPVFQVRSSEHGLRPGDLLVPRKPEAPVLLVGSELIGSLVSSQFLALHPDAARGFWIWAVLNSRSGQTLRRHFATGTLSDSYTRARLLELHIPWPSAERVVELNQRLADIESQTHRPEEEAAETWWRTADLRETEWRLALATPDLDIFNRGIPLHELCREIVRGRHTPHELFSDQPAPGDLPVTNIAVLGGRPVHLWMPMPSAPTPQTIVATPGDVFLAAVGARPHAALAKEISVVDRNLFLLRLRDPAHGSGLVRYLNGQTGYGLRSVLLSGSVIPAMRQQDLRRLPVPPEALEDVPYAAPLNPLALQLEHELWS